MGGLWGLDVCLGRGEVGNGRFWEGVIMWVLGEVVRKESRKNKIMV